MKYYAVIDTNILVSALLSKHDDSATIRVYKKLLTGGFIPLYSKQILAEYEDVLHRKKFDFSEEVIDTLIALISHGINVVPTHPTTEILPDLDDVPFYEVVLEKRDDNAYLVTGNIKHFPKKTFVVTAAEFLKIIDGDN